MASSNFDNCHLKLARSINDIVYTASLDGRVTSAQRTDYLNRANKFIQNTVWKLGKTGKYLQGLIATQALTFAAGGTSVAADFAYQWGCQKDGTPNIILDWVDPSVKIELDAKNRPDLLKTGCFTVLGKKVYAYYNGAQLTSGAGTFYYIANDNRVGAADSADIAIDSLWFDTIVEIAKTYYLDKQDGDSRDAKRTELVMSVL